MKVKEITKRGEVRYLVDGKVNGTRQRMFFDTKPQAERWLKAEQQDTTCQNWCLNLSNGDRADMMNAFERSRDIGFTLLSAVDHFAIEGSGKKFLKKMTLSEALGNTGRDRRRKSQAVVLKASGFLGDKVLAGIGHGHLAGLQCVLNNFVKFAGPTLECNAVSPELIKSWLSSGGAKGKEWTKGAMRNYSGHLQNLFNWLIRQDVVRENPVLKLEKINVGPFDPYVLSVEECRKVLNFCREKHFEILPLLALNLFCGIRPSETRRLSSSKGRDGNFDWEDNEVIFQAKKTKTKMRRFVEMSDNCLAWLGVQELNLPIVNANHKWDTFLRDARKALGYKTWPHDCIRHSFCSYGLRHVENAGKVALQAGNTEKVLFDHYLKLVSKADAEKFWNIYPEDAETQFQVVAA